MSSKLSSPPPPPPPPPRAGRLRRFHRFASDFIGGVRSRDVERMFRRDASRALAVLTQERGSRREGKAGLLETVQLLFVGLSFKLTPARRILFAAALVAAALGIADMTVNLVPGYISVDWSPFWFLSSIGALIFLLALELVDRVQVRDELEVARQLQRDLLPAGAVVLPGLTVAHAYRTANEVGGDVYDFLELADGRLALMMGDASGHGMAAGLLMATAKATLGAAIDLDPTPETVVQNLNRRLYATGDRRSFFTLFYGLLDPATGTMEYANAAHPFPLLRRADGSVEEIGTGSLPLGLRPEVAVEVRTVTLGPQDLLLLYTDGLPEAVDETAGGAKGGSPGVGGQAFGFQRLRALVEAGGEPQVLVDRLLRALDAHLSREEIQDDVSLVALAREPR